MAARKKPTFTCPDCDCVVEVEGLCDACKTAYSNATDGEGENTSTDSERSES
jgi:hypothetical protein